MIMFFNRREILVTYDMRRCTEVCDALTANGIDFRVKVTNRQGASAFGGRGRLGSFGMTDGSDNEYKIYIHKNDYESALRLIR